MAPIRHPREEMIESIKRNYIDASKTAWATPDGVLHIDAVRVCEVLGIPPTQENQDRIEAEARAVMAKELGNIPVQSIDDLL